MITTPPKFWKKPVNWYDDLLVYLLEPVSWLYRGGAALHQKIAKPYQASVPVISIGNFVIGGAGKTPLTLALAEQLRAMGRVPHIISRGYGGSLTGPIQVDLETHHFHQVGDEPLLLAQMAPTWVSRNRRAAVPLALEKGADILLLDDGHQNYALKKDMSFMVVNAAQGFGNGRVFPAGPLRQTLRCGLRQTSVVVCICEVNDPLPEALSSLPCPLLRAYIVPLAPKPCSVMAFSGIGYPEKFHQTLKRAGYTVKDFFSFPDHHPYAQKEIQKLRDKARFAGVPLITTEKDYVRLPPPLRSKILTLPIHLVFEEGTILKELLKGVCNKFDPPLDHDSL